MVMDRTAKLRKEWEDLNTMLHEREAKLEEAGDLHRFLKDLDHFQVSTIPFPFKLSTYLFLFFSLSLLTVSKKVSKCFLRSCRVILWE